MNVQTSNESSLLRHSATLEHLGRTLVVLRRQRGMKQVEVAREAGIAKGKLSCYENGKVLPKLSSLERILGALKVSFLDFFATLAAVAESTVKKP